MDFGDVIFFIVFVIIIVSNIMKQLKKSGSKTAETEKPAKKAGWKNILETMLEEARKQMENTAAPESAGIPLKHKSHKSGWEDIISGGDLISGQPVEAPGKVSLPKKIIRPALIPQEPVRDKAVFRPECMSCGDLMKKIEDTGSGVQNGLVYCERCGEQHIYKIAYGEMELKQKSIPKKSKRSVESQYQSIETIKEKSKKRCVGERQDCYAAAGSIGTPSKLSREGLRNAVVWSEILASPLGLRDFER